jgi:hypothetical protein
MDFEYSKKAVGGKVTFIIHEVYKDYVPMPKKGVALKQQKMQDYENYVLDAIPQ